MARYSALALAALLSLPMYARADDVCERTQAPQQARGQQPDAKNGRADQGQPHQPPPHWWIDPQLRQQLGITDAQSKSVEEIWQKMLPDLRKLREQLDKLESDLSNMIQDGAVESTVTAQIEQTENTRALLNKGRTLMLYRMNKVLTSDQRTKVKAMFPPRDDHRDGRRRGSR
jgi:Spy/CpxP family protein refolding chaperone